MSVPATIMRGGTSKGVFLHARDLPPAGPGRDAVVLDVMGSPDPMQIDGLGGTYSSTSKVIVVEPGSGGDDVRYWFGQVGVDRPIVDWSGNCGNLTTAVGPFAIEEGLVRGTDPVTRVLLRNGNTGVLIEAEVPTPMGTFHSEGTHVVPGVPRPGAPIVTRYLRPAGAVFGTLFPTGEPSRTVGTVDASIVDVAHPYVFVRAADVGVDPDRPRDLAADPAVLRELELLRGRCAALLDRVNRAEDAAESSPTVPRLVLVASPDGDDHDVRAVALSMGQVHHALPMTGALCLAAAVRLAGTVPAAVAAGPVGETVRIRHPKGVVAALADVPAPGEVASVGVVRTARRLMRGEVFPHDAEQGVADEIRH
jgi:hypothetical protein